MGGGLRQMYPYLSLHDGHRSAVAWFYDMGANFPKALGVDGNVLTFDIWPAWANDFLVRRGQSKEHDLYLSLADTVRSPDEAEGIYFDHEIIGIGIWEFQGTDLSSALETAVPAVFVFRYLTGFRSGGDRQLQVL